MIDICEFAVGLSRQLYGKTIASERPGHRLMETWHPLGVVGVITAFNFPVAVWSWNTAIALVCGDTVVWKPSELTPLTALACQALIERAAADVGAPREVSRLVQGGREVGERLVDDPRVALLSATGSVRMGQQVGPRVAQRFGKALLELGGNNAAIVTPSADLDLAVRGIVFSAAGTAGQRCTTLRRLIVHSLGRRRARRAHRRRLPAAADRRPGGRGHAGRSADPRDGLPRHGRRPRAGPRRRRRGRSAASAMTSATRAPTTSRPRSCGCRRRPRSCTTRRSRRSSTC